MLARPASATRPITSDKYARFMKEETSGELVLHDREPRLRESYLMRENVPTHTKV